MSDLTKNVWELNQWYDQNYAGNVYVRITN